MKIKIYTKTGDKGETSLFTGQRVPKDDPIIKAIGALDECNSAIGMAIALLFKEEKLKNVRKQLETIQHTLFDVGAALATPQTKSSSSKLEKTRFDSDGTACLERWMDEMNEELPELHQFILPGGHPSGAMLHMARTICRRAEQLVVPLNQRSDVSDNVLVYLNRLSDYLFMASRYVNHLMKVPESTWQPHKKPS